MAGRIITLQRQVRELGRLRAGYTVYPTEPGKRPYPTSSKTWILTSANRAYIEAAAELWGGQVEQWQPLGKGAQEWRVITQRPAIDAILPPGDPINQAYEMWGGGGCVRRCDGETEARSQKPCLCRAQFGDDFHTVPVLGPDKKPQRCQVTTRLSVFLPDLPDIGVWRVESHGYWPSVHVVGYVETIKGLVGPSVMVPVLLGIEPRTKVREGRTSHYVEVVVSLKERTSFGQIIAAPAALAIGGPSDARTIEAGPERAAIESGGQPAVARDWVAEIAAETSIEKLRGMWKEAPDDTVRGWVEQRVAQLQPPPSGEEQAAISEYTADPAMTEDQEFESGEFDDEQPAAGPARETVWMQILALGAQHHFTTAQCSQLVRQVIDKDVTQATGAELLAVVEYMRTHGDVSAVTA